MRCLHTAARCLRCCLLIDHEPATTGDPTAAAHHSGREDLRVLRWPPNPSGRGRWIVLVVDPILGTPFLVLVCRVRRGAGWRKGTNGAEDIEEENGCTKEEKRHTGVAAAP